MNGAVIAPWLTGPEDDGGGGASAAGAGAGGRSIFVTDPESLPPIAPSSARRIACASG